MDSIITILQTIFTLIVISYFIYTMRLDIYRAYRRFKYRKLYKSDLYKYKRRKVFGKVLSYYYDLGYPNPEEEAEDALRDYEDSNTLDELYENYFGKEKSVNNIR